MVLEDRPFLQGLLRIALVLFLLVLAVVAIDLLSRLGVHHPSLAGFITLLILAAIFAVGWIVNRRRTL